MIERGNDNLMVRKIEMAKAAMKDATASRLAEKNETVRKSGSFAFSRITLHLRPCGRTKGEGEKQVDREKKRIWQQW